MVTWSQDAAGVVASVSFTLSGTDPAMVKHAGRVVARASVRRWRRFCGEEAVTPVRPDASPLENAGM